MNLEKILSICIPIYNGGESAYWHIKEILTYKKNDIEIVVSDNASTDNTLELLSNIKDNRLKIIKHKKNRGPFFNWYAALMGGMAKYVMLHQDNDKLVLRNLMQYISFLKNVQYDVIRNTSGVYKGVSGELTVAQVQYYNVLYGHASNVVYLREALHSIIPLQCSFSPYYTSYPYSIWDTQILKKYAMNVKKAYLNGEIVINYSPDTYKKNVSRTKKFASNGFPSYSYENIIKKFLNYIQLLKHLYPRDKEYYKLVFNSYRINLYLATSHFYVIMQMPELKWMKRRYGLDVLDNNIDYLSLFDDFYKKTLSALNMSSLVWRIITLVGLKIITIYNKNEFLLYYDRKMGTIQKRANKWRCRLLNMIVEKVCK